MHFTLLINDLNCARSSITEPIIYDLFDDAYWIINKNKKINATKEDC